MVDVKTTSQVLNAMVGLNGSVYISQLDSPVTGEFFSIACIEKTKFKVLTDLLAITDKQDAANKVADAVVDNCIEFPAGIQLYGKFTEIRLHSGSVIAYKEDLS